MARPPAAAVFYALALGVSWGVWAPWVMSVQGAPRPSPRHYLHLAGSIGPAVAALVVLRWTGGGERIRQLIRRTVTARAALLALVWAILIPTALFVATAVFLGLASERPVAWNRIGVVPEYPGLGPAAYGLASLVFYGFGEEVGWRGFLYPRLRERHRPLVASLLVVPFWAFWHLPLFFATESYRAMGIGGAAGWLASLVSGSLLTAWLYDRARGSVLPAAVLHAVLDVFFLADVGVPIQSVLGAIVTVAGLVVAVGLFRHPAPKTPAPERGGAARTKEREPRA
jgi:membrane protease YdiL (CAAX protease family)